MEEDGIPPQLFTAIKYMCFFKFVYNILYTNTDNDLCSLIFLSIGSTIPEFLINHFLNTATHF